MVSGTISLPCSGFFSPFLHSTRSLSVSREYLALPDGPGRFAQDSSCPALLRIPLCCISLHILDYHRLWSHFPKCSVHDLHTISRSYNPAGALRRQRFGLFPVRSPLLGESFIYFLFLQVLRCFSSLRSPHLIDGLGIAPDGLPHSDICGSMRICRSPQLFAACHVLPRLREPRHPPYALVVPLCLNSRQATCISFAYDLLVVKLCCVSTLVFSHDLRHASSLVIVL